MDHNVFEGKWKQLRGEAKKQWGKLTDDDLDIIDGQRDKLVGKLQERYGHNKDDAEREYLDWTSRYEESTKSR